MEITDELIQSIETRVIQYCVAAYKGEPYEVRIEEGVIYADYVEYHCGESETETHAIPVEKLTMDLEEVSRIRIENEKAAAETRRIEAKKQRKIQENRETENRRRKYNELKKEFD